MLNLFLSILPGILIIIYVYKKDKHEQEPYKYIIICVLLGMLSCLPAILGTIFMQNITGSSNDSMNIISVGLYAFGAVAFSEELAKFIFLRYYIYRQSEFDEPMDGIVYGVAIGMGFAILENVLYVSQGGLQVALLRMFTAVPGHAAFGVFMGYYVGLAKFATTATETKTLLMKGLLSAIAIHGVYDFFLFQDNFAGLSFLAFAVLILGISMSRKLIKMHVDNSPHRNDIDNEENHMQHLIDDK